MNKKNYGMLNFHKRKMYFALHAESCIVKLIVFTRYNVRVNFLRPAFDEFELEFNFFFSLWFASETF